MNATRIQARRKPGSPGLETGDFGRRGPDTRKRRRICIGYLCAKCAEEKLHLTIITEGTRVTKENSNKQDLTENQVFQKTSDLLKKNKMKLVFSTFRGNDIDRINSFYSACKKADRNLVVSMKTAVLLESLSKDKNLRVPRVGKYVFPYIRRKSSGSYDDKDYFKWERQFLDSGMTCEDVKKDQGGTFLHLDFWNLPEIIDIEPESGGAYIHASSEAFNEEGEEEEQVMGNWVDHFGFSYSQIHASGHAKGVEVGALVNNIDTERTIPIHTEYPDYFSTWVPSRKLLLPKKNAIIKLV